MSTETIYETNTKIALFMGGEFRTVYWGGVPTEQFCLPDKFHISEGDCRRKLHYHDSWDWLMPVLDKIEQESNFTTQIISSGVDEHQCRIGIDFIIKISTKRIEAVYLAVIKYINTAK